MPNRFLPISQSSDLEDVKRVVNANFAQIDNESITKTFKQAGGNAIVQGQLPDGSYGSIYYDSDNIARVLIGIYDGRPGIWISKDGLDVLEELAA